MSSLPKVIQLAQFSTGHRASKPSRHEQLHWPLPAKAAVPGEEGSASLCCSKRVATSPMPKYSSVTNLVRSLTQRYLSASPALSSFLWGGDSVPSLQA